MCAGALIVIGTYMLQLFIINQEMKGRE